jgi:hypothetical protein
VPRAFAEAGTEPDLTAVPVPTLVVLDGAGHVPTITRPHEVVEAIEAWWADVEAYRSPADTATRSDS